jgi:GxxExxY protein
MITQRRKDAKPSSPVLLTENEIATIVVDAAYHIHQRLGPGLLESVYEAILAHELRKRGLDVKRQLPVPAIWDNLCIDVGFRFDLLVNDLVLVELKSKEKVIPVDKKQALTHIRLMNKRLALLINFGEELIKNGISRIVNGLPD